MYVGLLASSSSLRRSFPTRVRITRALPDLLRPHTRCIGKIRHRTGESFSLVPVLYVAVL